MLNGQVRPDAGEIRILGENVSGMSPDKIWRRGVGRTFQITATFGSMTVRENVQMALINYHGDLMKVWRSGRNMHRESAMDLLKSVGIADQAERACGVLAYGDLKRVELAVALANEPKVLLMDEPTAGMAPRERLELMSLARDIVVHRGVSVLFTEHDMDVVFGKADRIIVLNRGNLIAEGSPTEIRNNSQVQEIYLGSGKTYRAQPINAEGCRA
jgi:branched-chain amino acid transport system ATP-binding protein